MLGFNSQSCPGHQTRTVKVGAACNTAVLAHVMAICSFSQYAAGPSVCYDVYGVFDGHGGKQAAAFASKHILPILQEQLAGVDVNTDASVPEELESFPQVSDEDKLVWQTQDALLQKLPEALVQTFKRVQDQFHEHTQVGGHTCFVLPS